MKAALARIKMQLEKLQDEMTILEKQVKALEEEVEKVEITRFDDNFSRDKEDFIAP